MRTRRHRRLLVAFSTIGGRSALTARVLLRVPWRLVLVCTMRVRVSIMGRE